MSTPSDPQRVGQQPDQGPYGRPEGAGAPGAQPEQYGPPQYGPPGQYGQPGQYGAAGQYGQPGQTGQYGQQAPPYGSTGQQPGQYGSQPYPGQPYGGQPFTGDAEQYAYNPYGTPYPAGLGAGDISPEEPATRPGIMVLALLLHILAALPFLAIGALLLLVPFDASSIPLDAASEQQLSDAGVTRETLVSLLRTGAGVLLALAVAYVLFAVLAFRGRNWARIILTILTVAFALLLLGGLFSGAGADPGSLALLLVVLLASVGGTVILFLREPNRFFAAPRR